MKLMFKYVHLTRWLFLFIALTAVLACKSYLTYEGQEVAEEDRIEIKTGGPNEGAMRTNDLTFDYAYERNGDDFTLSGTISWANHLLYNFKTMEHFSLMLYFVDGSGKIIEEKNIVRSGHYVEIENLSFEKQFSLPAGAVAMVFGYSGKAVDGGSASSEGGRGEQIDWDFWKSPVQRRVF